MLAAAQPLASATPLVLRRSSKRRQTQAQALVPRPLALSILGRRQAAAALKPRAASARAQAVDGSVAHDPIDPATLPYEVADMEDLLKETDACGVGIIASLAGDRSHKVITQALTALTCMEHRGGCSADNDSGDGSGLMTQIPWALLNAGRSREKLPLLIEGATGVGMLFLSPAEESARKARALVESTLAAAGLAVAGWRSVPVDHGRVGPMFKAMEPSIHQVFVTKAGVTGDELEHALYLGRKAVERAAAAQPQLGDVYFCSLSTRTVVYKGMLRSEVLGRYYADLGDSAYDTAFAIYHRRFSTNTTPKWPLAQPFRYLGHNGEINTLQGNLNWVTASEASWTHPVWAGDEAAFRPVCDPRASDSANLDRAAEVLIRSGQAPEEALMVLVPEAYKNHPDLEATYPAATAFYDYYAGMQEAWDGPALLIFSDGKTIGARLDRNGLRPARYWRTADGMVYIASEVGVLGDVIESAANVVEKGRVGPGQCVTVDLATGTFYHGPEVARRVAAKHPYAAWVAESVRSLPKCLPLATPSLAADDFLRLQVASGYSSEDTALVIEYMLQEGKEATYCMGDDAPLACLSAKPHMLYDYFKQRFAQVTNPPIDPLREGLVMSLEMRLGRRGNVLLPGAAAARGVLIPSPVLLEPELAALQSDPALAAVTLPMRFSAGKGKGALAAALAALTESAAAAVRGGAELIILSDRPTGPVDRSSPAIPALLAVGAVHHGLIAAGLRTRASLAVDTAAAFSTHHVACLVGYGASAVCPYLALETARQWRASERVGNMIQKGKISALSAADVQLNLRKALNGGLLKILSKMGISLLSSYHGAQIFEAYGIGADIIATAFKGTVSRVGGVSLDELASEVESFWGSAFPATALPNFGFIQSRPGMEFHGNNQDMSKMLHKAIGLGGGAPAPGAFALYQQYLAATPAATLRDMLEIASDRAPVPLESVEPASAIVERFCTGGMSLGAISRETHEAIAIAMNRLGGKSNSGEGGEDPVRWIPLANVGPDGKSSTLPHLRGLRNGDTATSAIKQVASGRFGVTPQFLMNAEQLEIKIAQGAKPGEGGQLPGKKVSPYIAALRRSKPGVPLISPPPHHDIYSIEDLAQLIYDLHQVNPAAKVSVKLVGEAGIGTVASGVAKANADVIQISGHDGGTGASPISSIKHAGGPWEMGLVESHKTLVDNGLRERVVLRSDGGYKCGRDVLLAALMGADEYGFGTVAMIATGCVMARICHTNNCPVGVASQREELRARFPGAPSDLVNFFLYVAEETRALLATMGYTSLDEVVGRLDLLRQKPTALAKTAGMDLTFLTTAPASKPGPSSRRRTQAVHTNGPVLDDELLAYPSLQAAIATEGSATLSAAIVNTDRSVCGRIAGAIAKKYGDGGFAGSVTLSFVGSAGQSFGCFLLRGMHVRLEGEANDYVGKGMAGGEIVIVAPKAAPFKREDAALVGNTCLYGATGGRLFVGGRAGERFAVRNSLAEAVVEGAGDHCCEYMTGGCVVVLGKVGRNVGAGMTGGLAYFYDADGSFPGMVNGEICTMLRVTTPAGEQQLKRLVAAHVEKTGSALGGRLLADWAASLTRFYQLVPPSEASTPEARLEGAPPIPVKAISG